MDPITNKLTRALNKMWVIDLLLFSVSFCIYFFYFTDVFLDPNGLLSSVIGDSIKNYYTFVYHIKNDSGFLNFAGMNFPYGEHVIYTDSHPILTLILKYLPFTHNYLIGIMHVLIFLSYLIAPSVTNRVFIKLGFDRLSGFFISIGLTLLAPQFHKVYAGHYAMTYAFIVPLGILLTLSYFKERTGKAALNMFLYNLLLFFIHPYPAFGVCVFMLMSMGLFELLNFNRQTVLKTGLFIFICTLLPMILFKAFMIITDHHANRPVLPHGFETGVCTPGSILVPLGGPFESFMASLFNTRPGQFEGFCYMGIAFITLTFIFALCLPFLYKKLRFTFTKELLVMLVSAVILLLFSLGIHLKYISMTNETLNQFRALGRFSWFFYYMLPIFIFTVLYHYFKTHFSRKQAYTVFGALTFVFFIFNLVEAGGVFRLYEPTAFKDRNFFSEFYLNAEEKALIKKLDLEKPQAILPLPTYNIGSDIYDRARDTSLVATLVTSFLYSHHTGLPIASAMLSRNSISETEEVVQLINPYKKNRDALKLLDGRPFFVIKNNAPMMPDEDRILQRTNMFQKNDSLEFGYLPQSALLSPILDKKIITLNNTSQHLDSNMVYIQNSDKKPFVRSNSEGYEVMFQLDSNKFESGKYILSFHYHYKNDTWKDMLCHYLLTNGATGEWYQFASMRLQSGFYKGFGVFEYYLNLDKKTSYNFIVKNDESIFYRVSDFMLRPAGTSVLLVKAKNDTVYNNFPMY